MKMGDGCGGRQRYGESLQTTRRNTEKESIKMRRRTKKEVKVNKERTKIEAMINTRRRSTKIPGRPRKVEILNLRRILEGGSGMMKKEQQLAWSKTSLLQLIEELRAWVLQVTLGRKVLQVIKWLQVSLVQCKREMRNSILCFRRELRAWGLPLLWRSIKLLIAKRFQKIRKEFENNGFLLESQHDVRPNKLPRSSASSHSPVENGRPLEFVHNALPCDSAKLGAINNTKIERGLYDNGNHLNGMMVAQSKYTLLPPAAPIVPHVLVDSSKNAQLPLKPPPPNKSDKVPAKPPHPDTKYLSTIYSAPKAEELLESDDQEWLFSSENPLSNTNLEVDATRPQVWATGLQIEAADVFALPYVIPF